MPARTDDPDWLKRMYAEGRITERTAVLTGLIRQTVGELRDENEAAFQDRVVILAHDNVWKVAHCRPGRVKRDGKDTYETPWLYDGKGMTDLILARERVVWIECKSEKGVLRPDQEKWRDILLEARQEWYCFRPSDWPKIEAVLK